MTILLLLLTAKTTPADEEPTHTAERLMRHQLKAPRHDGYTGFIANGNEAFRLFMVSRSFERLSMQQQSERMLSHRPAQLGRPMFLWTISLEKSKSEPLGSLSLSHGKVVGFDLY